MHILPALFVWLVLLVAATKIPLEEVALVAGTKQNLSNLDIYGNPQNLVRYLVGCHDILCLLQMVNAPQS
jgi:hypothetical protein